MVVVNVIADGVTFSNSGQITHENSHNISNSNVSGSFNNSSPSPRSVGRVSNGFNYEFADLGFAHINTNDGGRGAHTRRAGAPSQPPPSQTVSEARRPPASLNTQSETDYKMVAVSESNKSQVVMPRSTVGKHGSPSYPPNPLPQCERRVYDGPPNVRQETSVHDSAHHHRFSDVQSTDKEPRKRARRSKRSRNMKANTAHLSSQDSSDPSTPSHSLYISRSTSPSHSMLHSPVASHPVPASHCSPLSCSCARSQSPMSPIGIPSPMPYEYWAVPAQHVMIPAQYLSHPHPVYLAPAYPFAHPSAFNPVLLSQSPKPHLCPSAPIPAAQPVPLYVQQSSETPQFRTHPSYHHPNTIGDTACDRHPHTNAAANESGHHQATQTSDCPSSSNISTFTAHTSGEGRPRMTPESNLPLAASPACSSQRMPTRKASFADTPEPVSKRARRQEEFLSSAAGSFGAGFLPCPLFSD